MFTVDQVIQDHYPALDSKPWLARPVKGLLRNLLHEKDFISFADRYPHLEGIDFVEQVLDYFDFSYTVSDKDKERIPATGRVVIIANHPIGSLDGLALIKLVSEVRPDTKVVANSLLMNLKPLHPMLLPVNNMGGQTPKENLQRINQHLDDEGAIIIFPSGEVSRLKPNGVRDTRWRAGFLKMATQTQSPILPICVMARNSALFYGVSMLYKPLATMLLVKEMFRQQERSLRFKIGDPVPYESYSSDNIPQQTKVKLFKRHLYAIGKGKKGVLKSHSGIAHPENRAQLKQEVERCELLGETQDGKRIYLYRYQGSSTIMREIGRLREIAFRAVGEGSGQKRDVDNYDAIYQHILLWDREELEIVGAYRLGDTKQIIEQHGTDGLYTYSLFEFEQNMQQYLPQGLELGRSFVQPRYWGKRSLDYLWQGIGAFLSRYPRYRYLFGGVTMSGTLPPRAKDLLVYFYKLYFGDREQLANSKRPYNIGDGVMRELQDTFSGDDYKQDFTRLKHLLANMGVAVPTLYKQYSELCESDGVKFIDFGVDPDFANCIDGLVLVDIHKLKPKKRQRYMSDSMEQAS